MLSLDLVVWCLCWLSVVLLYAVVLLLLGLGVESFTEFNEVFDEVFPAVAVDVVVFEVVFPFDHVVEAEAVFVDVLVFASEDYDVEGLLLAGVLPFADHSFWVMWSV